MMLLGGCLANPPVDVNAGSFPRIEDLKDVPLPEYRKGQYFSYDNNRTELIDEVADGVISWRNNRGFSFQTGRDFVQPYARWQWEDQEGTSEPLFQRDNIWPLAQANSSFVLRYRVENISLGGGQTYSPQIWRCETAGSFRVTVQAGDFDAVKIDCVRRIGTRSFLYRTWYYAPSVGHYVLRQDFRLPGGKRKRIELLSWGVSLSTIPDEVRQVLREQVQDMLEYRTSEEIVHWKAAVPDREDYRGSLQPMRTFKTERGFWCRDYRLIFDLADQEIVQNRTACREKDGIWVEVS